MAFIQVAYNAAAAKTLIANPQAREDALDLRIARRQAGLVLLLVRGIRRRDHRGFAGQHGRRRARADDLIEGRDLEIPHHGAAEATRASRR